MRLTYLSFLELTENYKFASHSFIIPITLPLTGLNIPCYQAPSFLVG